MHPRMQQGIRDDTRSALERDGTICAPKGAAFGGAVSCRWHVRSHMVEIKRAVGVEHTRAAQAPVGCSLHPTTMCSLPPSSVSHAYFSLLRSRARSQHTGSRQTEFHRSIANRATQTAKPCTTSAYLSLYPARLALHPEYTVIDTESMCIRDPAMAGQSRSTSGTSTPAG